MALKLKPADSWFSKCIRERAAWKCEVCEKQYEPGTRGLHCSHFYSRRHRSTRWCKDNAAAHCWGCHMRLGGEPINFHDWIQQRLGDGRYELLREKHNQIVKIPKSEQKAIAAHYKQQFQWMQAQRAEGKVGWLEFESWQ